MTPEQIITAVIALTGTVIALVSLTRTGKLQRQQARFQAKQEELIDLQLEALRKQASQPHPISVPRASDVGSASSSHEKADVRADLVKSGRGHRFMITNWGMGPAKDVSFTVQPKPGRESPLVPNDIADKLPISDLASGSQVPILAALSFDTGTTFSATWRWTDPDGSVQERTSVLAI